MYLAPPKEGLYEIGPSWSLLGSSVSGAHANLCPPGAQAVLATGHWRKHAKSVFDSFSYFLSAPLSFTFPSYVTFTPIVAVCIF